MSSKKIRLNRIFANGTIAIMPIDHGVTMGMLRGIDNYMELIQNMLFTGLDGIVAHKGIVQKLLNLDGVERLNIFQHLSASTNFYEPNYKVIVSTVEEALRNGIDQVSIHLNLNVPQEREMMRDFADIAESCERWGVPLMAMIYVQNHILDVQTLRHAMRVAEELGADLVKIPMPEQTEFLENLIGHVNIPVLVAGGECSKDQKDFLTQIDRATSCGASGIAVGRNIFERENPQAFARIVTKLVHRTIDLQQACEMAMELE